MADNIWDNSDGDYDGNVAANWSLGWVPKAGDVAVFDSATTSDNCTFSGAITCDGMRFDNTYAGTVDAATYDITLGTDGLDCTGGGSATLDLGSGTWTCSGDWDYEDIGTFSGANATVEMTGAGVSYKGKGHASNQIGTLNINSAGTVTVTANSYVNTAVNVTSGTFSLGSARAYLSNVTISGSATFTGSTLSTCMIYTLIDLQDTATVNGTWIHVRGTLTKSAGSSFAPTYARIFDNSIIGDGTWGGSWLWKYDTNGDKAITFGTGASQTVTLTDSLEIRSDRAYDVELVNDTHNPNLVFEGGLNLNESVGTITWTKGTGTITFSGTADQTVTTPAGWTDVLEDIEIDKSAGNFVLAGNVYTDSFTGTSTGSGDFDPAGNEIATTGNCSWAAAFLFDSAADCLNGCTWDIGGNFTADGQTLNATAAWYLEVTGTAVASGTGDVEHSDASGHTEIDASAGPWTDSGNNTNWNFGAATEGHMMFQPF